MITFWTKVHESKVEQYFDGFLYAQVWLQIGDLPGGKMSIVQADRSRMMRVDTETGTDENNYYRVYLGAIGNDITELANLPANVDWQGV